MPDDTRPDIPAVPVPSVTATGPAEGNWRERAEQAETERDRLTAELEHAKSALAGDHEGIRLWMLDCGELVAKHRARAEAAEAKLAEVRQRCQEAAGIADLITGTGGKPIKASPLIDAILAIIGTGEEPS